MLLPWSVEYSSNRTCLMAEHRWWVTPSKLCLRRRILNDEISEDYLVAIPVKLVT